MPLRELTPELAKLAKDELGEIPSRIPEDLQYIKDWLSKQPHITARTDDQWLIAFLRGCKYSLERTKEKLDNFYTMKTMAPEFTMCIDPLNSEIQNILKTGCVIPLLKPISPGGPRVIIIHPGIFSSTDYSMFHCMKLSHMFSEILMMEDDNTVVAGQRLIGDMQGIDIGHFTQMMTPSTVKKMVHISENSMPIRQKGAHHLNFPSSIETLFSWFKSFMNEKNRQRIFVHRDLDDLYKYIPKEILPTEYGGDAGPIKDMIGYWEQKLLDYRDWFLEDEKYKTDEKKRPGRPKTAEGLFGVDGSFRQLNVD